jgi:hypothetical protein
MKKEGNFDDIIKERKMNTSLAFQNIDVIE